MVREFHPSDREALRRIYLEARRAAFRWEPPDAHRLEDFDQVTKGERILVAECGGQPVGFAAIWEPESFVHSLFVDPAYQRRGIGKELLDACAGFFTRRGTLKCLQANREAVAFYRALGWTVGEAGDGPDGSYYLFVQPETNR